MTFDAREARARAAEIYKPFIFTGYDGETYELAHAKMIDPALTKAMQSDDSDEREKAMEAFAPEAWPAIQAMEPGVQVMVMEAWQEHSGLGEGDDDEADDAGKGRPQSSAPNRAARRSKPTSRSAGSTSTSSRSGKSKAASGSS